MENIDSNPPHANGSEHGWQFARINSYEAGPDSYMFVCECGSSKTVEAREAS